MKGILLAGGTGSRLFPATLAISKQLLPIFDKPMIYYPLSTLMFANIREILIISTPQDLPRFRYLLKDGSQLGMKFHYAVQSKPEGLAQAFIIGEKFINQDSVALILGDNIFYGHGFCDLFKQHLPLQEGAFVFGYHVKNPNRYGIAEFNENFKVTNIEEKPTVAKSNYAVCGLYFYDNEVVSIAKSLKPSKRGGLEITDVNNIYVKKKKLTIEVLNQGFAWLDAGTFEAFQNASSFVQTIQERQGVQIACIEEIAYRMGFIDEHQLGKLAEKFPNEYGDYLRIVQKKVLDRCC